MTEHNDAKSTTLTGRGATPPSLERQRAAIAIASSTARTLKRERIGDLDDGGTLTVQRGGHRYLVAYGVEHGMVAVTVLYGGQWRTKAPTGLQGSPAKTLERCPIMLGHRRRILRL